jgi:hypothetical protein
MNAHSTVSACFGQSGKIIKILARINIYMKLNEIAERWYVQNSPIALAHPAGPRPIFDKPESFGSHDEALQHLIKMMCSIFATLGDSDWMDDEHNYWCNVTLADMKSDKDFASPYVEDGKHWFYSVGTDGDVIVSRGAPYGMPNYDEIVKDYEKAGLVPKSGQQVPRKVH